MENEAAERAGLAPHLDSTIAFLVAQIQEISVRESISSDHLKLVAELGHAAYHLALAKEASECLANPNVVSEETPEAMPVMLPIEVDTPIEDKTDAVLQVEDTAVVDLIDVNDSVKPPINEVAVEAVADKTRDTDRQRVIDVLRSAEGRLSPSELSRAISGKSRLRLSRAQEQEIESLLLPLIESGLVEKYGKTYRYISDAERQERLAEINKDFEPIGGLQDFDKSALALFEELTEKNERINIGLFVRTYYSAGSIAPDEFEAVKNRLNLLAEINYLTHETGAWYAMGAKRLPKNIDLLLQAEGRDEVEMALETLESEPEMALPEQIELTAAEVNTSGLQLTDREQKMFDVMLELIGNGDWFQQGIFDFSTLKFSSDGAKRQAFTKLSQKLVEAGVLATAGQKGGKKYRLILNKPSANEEILSSEAAAVITEPKKEEVVHTKTDSVIKAEPIPELSESDIRRGLNFFVALNKAVQQRLQSSPDQKIKLKEMVEELASAYRQPAADVRQWIGELANHGHIFYNSTKGVRMLTLEPPKQTSKTPQKTQEIEKPQSDPKLWTRYDVDNAIRVFGELLKLKHVQQGIQQRDLIQVLGIADDEVPEFRRSLRRMAQRGYLYIDPRANFNTRSDRSKRLYVPVVKFKDQATKIRIKEFNKEVMAEMEAMIGTKANDLDND